MSNDDLEFDSFFAQYDTEVLNRKQELFEKLLALEKDMTELERMRQEQTLTYLTRKQEILRSIPESEIQEYLLKQNIKKPPVEFIYIIQSDISPNFYRIGSIDYMHNKPLVGFHDHAPLNKVFAVVPTLNYARDIHKIKEVFESKLKNNGWYLLFDYEIKKYMENTILPLFNQEMNDLYQRDPTQTGIPPPDHDFIVPV